MKGLTPQRSERHTHLHSNNTLLTQTPSKRPKGGGLWRGWRVDELIPSDRREALSTYYRRGSLSLPGERLVVVIM